MTMFPIDRRTLWVSAWRYLSITASRWPYSFAAIRISGLRVARYRAGTPPPCPPPSGEQAPTPKRAPLPPAGTTAPHADSRPLTQAIGTSRSLSEKP